MEGFPEVGGCNSAYFHRCGLRRINIYAALCWEDVLTCLRLAEKIRLHFGDPKAHPVMIGVVTFEAVLNEDLLEVFERIVREGLKGTKVKKIYFWIRETDWNTARYNIFNL
jgi:hypothetical protein